VLEIATFQDRHLATYGSSGTGMKNPKPSGIVFQIAKGGASCGGDPACDREPPSRAGGRFNDDEAK
jgi:hypothetical protein